MNKLGLMFNCRTFTLKHNTHSFKTHLEPSHEVYYTKPQSRLCIVLGQFQKQTESYSFIQMTHWASAFSRRGLREGGEEKNMKIKMGYSLRWKLASSWSHETTVAQSAPELLLPCSKGLDINIPQQALAVGHSFWAEKLPFIPGKLFLRVDN